MLAWFDIILVFIFLALNDDVRIMLNVTVCHTSTPGAGYTADGGLLIPFPSHVFWRDIAEISHLCMAGLTITYQSPSGLIANLHFCVLTTE